MPKENGVVSANKGNVMGTLDAFNESCDGYGLLKQKLRPGDRYDWRNRSILKA